MKNISKRILEAVGDSIESFYSNEVARSALDQLKSEGALPPFADPVVQSIHGKILIYLYQDEESGNRTYLDRKNDVYDFENGRFEYVTSY